jgi:hypothetical protein
MKRMFQKKNGGMILQCQDKNNRQQTMDVLQNEFGQTVTIKEDTALTKMDFIVEKDRELPDNDTLTTQLIEDNDITQYVVDSRLKVPIKRKLRRGVMIIILVDQMIRKFLEQKNEMKIKWDHGRYALHNHVHVRICYGCQGYGHMKKDYRNEPACKRCAGNHNVWECQMRVHSCINCKKANIQHGSTYSIWHMAHHGDL